jgi:hypothetical protein
VMASGRQGANRIPFATLLKTAVLGPKLLYPDAGGSATDDCGILARWENMEPAIELDR